MWYLWSYPEALQCRKWLQPNTLDSAIFAEACGASLVFVVRHGSEKL